MRKLPDHTIQSIKDMRHQGYCQQEIADTLGVSVRSVKRHSKGEPMNRKGYKTLTLKHTDTGVPYYAGYTIHNNYVELGMDGGVWFTEAGVWTEGKDPSNCRRACQSKGV